MQSLGHFIVRLVAILFGVFIAMLAAGMFLSFGMFFGAFTEFFTELSWTLNGDPYHAEELDGLVTLLVVIAGFFTSFHVASIAALPAAIAIAIAEMMRWQGMTINLVLGGLVSLFTGLSLYGSLQSGYRPALRRHAGRAAGNRLHCRLFLLADCRAKCGQMAGPSGHHPRSVNNIRTANAPNTLAKT